jgi:4-amino-4-deoxy-L-arabinose transferase-like glycosyltransferase
MTVGHTYRFSHEMDDFGFGWETGRIARAIATGRGFSDPLQGHTGPTAWIAPLYPYLLAAIFKVFGVYSVLSSWIDLTINSFFSALNAVVIYRVADRLFSRKAAVWSAWIWAAFPYAWYWAIHWQWETSLAGLLLSCAVLLALRIGGVARTEEQAGAGSPRRDWILFGVVNGLIALTNPAILLWLPFAGVWALIQNSQREGWTRALQSAMLAGVIFLAMLAPWIARNWMVFHKLIPVRGNFWVEFHLGNTHGTDGLWAWWMHPSHNRDELKLYRELGEVGYVARARVLTTADIARDPRHFAYACFCRVVYFWYDTPRLDRDLGAFSSARNVLFAFSSVVAFLGAGLMVQRKRRGAFLFVLLLIAVPFVYYLTFPHPRYRAPLEPMMVVLGVYLFQSAERKKRA